MAQYRLSNERFIGIGNQTATVATGSANTVLAKGQGRLCRIVVTTAGSVAGPVLIYDSAGSSLGTAIFQIAANDAAGTIYDRQWPIQNGIVVQNVASGPALTISLTGFGATLSQGN